MSDPLSYLWIVIGVIGTVVLPVLAAYIRKEFPPTAAIGIPPGETIFTPVRLQLDRRTGKFRAVEEPTPNRAVNLV